MRLILLAAPMSFGLATRPFTLLCTLDVLFASSLPFGHNTFVNKTVNYAWPFQDPSLPWSQRTDDLVGRLTLQEKAAQLGHFDLDDPSRTSLGRASSPPIPRFRINGYNYGMECNTGREALTFWT